MSSPENNRYIVQVYVGALSALYEALSVEASKQTTSEEIVSCIVDRSGSNDNVSYELAEVIGDSYGQECKERSLSSTESPVQLMMLWPKNRTDQSSYRFYSREKSNDYLWRDFVMDPQLIRDYFHRFLYQPKDREYPDLCQSPDLNEQTSSDNSRARFVAGHIYTYVGSILIALNPFKFYPIYNPKYVKSYQNRRLGPNLPPHIFAVADTAYHCMLKDRKNQCIVISGESGSGKTESTNFLSHHLTALSQKGSHGSGVEQTILSAGPVLEAFGNAKTAHNNNSSRFGKFIQVNYKENGMVHGAVVQKYLLEKSRICSQGRNERNYHVFYYLLEGASEQEKQVSHSRSPDQYYYSNKSCYKSDNVDERYEFSRLKQSMEMVGFTAEKQRRLFSVLSAVLLLGNVEFQPRKSAYHHDEAVGVKNPEVVALISELLRVKQETLMQALIAKRARASGETLIINYRLPEATASRDAMAKCLYGALFDWIVLQVNHALLSKKDTLREHQGNSIGVLDIFGFEDFGSNNSFEQLCINYANEHSQYYFNQHVFKYEQEEYRKEGIRWTNIEFMDNTGCLQSIEGKPNGSLCVSDDQCNFPGATNETLLQKFNMVHKDNKFYQKPQKKEGAFIVVHYAGKVKYQVTDMREKNSDLMRQDIVGVLKNSSMAFVRESVGADPVAVFRWAIVRAFFRSYFAFHEAGRKQRQGRVDGNRNNIQQRYQRNHTPNENIISKQRNTVPSARYGSQNEGGAAGNNHNRLSWPQFYHRNAAAASRSGEEAAADRRRKESVGGASANASERVSCPDEAMAIQRANQIVMKNKSFRPRERGKKGLKNLQSVKTSAGRTGITGASQGQLGKARKQPTTVTAQFQQSSHSSMDTSNQANPFFIRCIKSNANKIPNKFDHETVQRQSRYTGMSETVRIRQAGFNVRLTYDEFIQSYRISLPKGLLSSQNDVRDFLATLNSNRDNYQSGISKVFLRESEKYKSDCKLHQQIMSSIIILQRWFRACLERRKFLRIKMAIVTIQSYCRMYSVQRYFKRVTAAVKIQKVWRGYKARSWYEKFKMGSVAFQAHCRGYKVRKIMQVSKGPKMPSVGTVQSHSQVKLASSDEAFVSKESSQEELRDNVERRSRDSDESSGIQEDGDTESLHSRSSYTMSSPTVTTTLISQQTSGLLPHQNRSADIKQEGVFLDLTSRRKITKAHRTIDYSDLALAEYQPADQRQQGSSDSLASQRSFGSQQSADSTQSGLRTFSTTSSSAAAAASRERWSSSFARSSETDSENGGAAMTMSAPPLVVGDRFSSYDNFGGGEMAARGGSEQDFSPKVQSARSPAVHWSGGAAKRETKSAGEVRSAGDSSKSLPPVRRITRFGSDEKTDVYYAYNHAPSKTEQILGKPEAPARSVRKAKRAQVKSLGEEVTDSGSGDKLVLGTIDESNVIHADAGAGKFKPFSKDCTTSTPKQALTPKRQRHHIGSDSRRRNSDPATNLITEAPSVIEHTPQAKIDSDDSQWRKANVSFTSVGHSFRKIARISKDDSCTSCNDHMDQFITHGYKCMRCKKSFHAKCIQNKKVSPCDSVTPGVDNSKGARRKSRKHSRTPYDLAKPDEGKFNLTKTSSFSDSTDQIINGSEELHSMQRFITEKIMKIEGDIGEKPSEVDRSFKQASREFKDNSVQIYSANKHGFEMCSVRYKDSICNFQQAMETVCQKEQKEKDKDFPVTMGLNAFRGFMNEFMSTRAEEKPNKTKRKKEKKRKLETIKFKGHNFLSTIINIPTACEICNSFFMWPIERGLVCQSCKLTCHKKCYTNIQAVCVKESAQGGVNRVFGVPSVNLITEENKIPVVIERLSHVIESNGSYTEGIYRKSGVSSKIKESKTRMDEYPNEIEFERYQVHVSASVLKSFLREMPEPLLTFECYENFITAANLHDPQDRVTTSYDISKKSPPINYDLMERSMFHSARVALHEEVNRMSAASLAIVFAPCVLRTNKVVPAQDSLHDIANQTQCIETIIREQSKKIRSTSEDINTSDTACQAANNRSSSLRSSKVFSPEESMPANQSSQQQAEEEEHLSVDHIQEIEKEKEHSTSTLPTLTHATSDDDMSSTDGDGSMDDISCIGEQRKNRVPVVRSISGGDSRPSSSPKLKRQSSSDVVVKVVEDCDDSIVV